MFGYKFIWRDGNKFGRGIAYYITDQLPSRTIKIENPSDIEVRTIEIQKRKILVAGICKPANLSETDFTTNLETFIPGKFYIKRNNNKADSKEPGRIVIAHLLP